MVKNFVYGLLLSALMGVCWACEHDHESDFAGHVPQSPTTNVTRYRGTYRTERDGATRRDTVCVADYVKARDSQTGDSLRLYYFRIEDGAPEIRQLDIPDIANLNQQFYLRHNEAEAYYRLSGEDLYTPQPFVVRALSGTATSTRLKFTVDIDGWVMTFDGENAIHTE